MRSSSAASLQKPPVLHARTRISVRLFRASTSPVWPSIAVALDPRSQARRRVRRRPIFANAPSGGKAPALNEVARVMLLGAPKPIHLANSEGTSVADAQTRCRLGTRNALPPSIDITPSSGGEQTRSTEALSAAVDRTPALLTPRARTAMRVSHGSCRPLSVTRCVPPRFLPVALLGSSTAALSSAVRRADQPMPLPPPTPEAPEAASSSPIESWDTPLAASKSDFVETQRWITVALLCQRIGRPSALQATSSGAR